MPTERQNPATFGKMGFLSYSFFSAQESVYDRTASRNCLPERKLVFIFVETFLIKRTFSKMDV